MTPSPNPESIGDDVVERLLHWAAIVPSPLACACMREAADKIEALTTATPALSTLPADKGLREAQWVPQLGEQVRVTEACKYHQDWEGVCLWVYSVRPLGDASDGLNVTVSEHWPPKQSTYSHGQHTDITDGFVVGRSGDQDDLAALNSTHGIESRD